MQKCVAHSLRDLADLRCVQSCSSPVRKPKEIAKEPPLLWNGVVADRPHHFSGQPMTPS